MQESRENSRYHALRSCFPQVAQLSIVALEIHVPEYLQRLRFYNEALFPLECSTWSHQKLFLN